MGKRLKPRVRQLFLWLLTPYFKRRPVMVQGHKMYISAAAPVLFSWDMMADSFEGGTTTLFKQVLREGMVVIDVGAHVGYYTLLAAKQVGASGKVYAFEAEPATYRLLVKNIKLNQQQNVVAVHKVVADCTSTLDLYLSSTKGKGIQQYNRIYRVCPDEHVVRVEATSLDDFMQTQEWPRVDLIKMDIDGGEDKALRGMERTLKRTDRLLLITEFYPEGLRAAGADPADFLVRLRALGFSVRLITDSGILETLDADALLRQLGPSDVVNLLCAKDPEQASNQTTSRKTF